MSLQMTGGGAAELAVTQARSPANYAGRYKSNIHLIVSLLLTALVLLGSGLIVYYAAEIREIEEVEADASRLLLNAERWLNLQQKIRLAVSSDGPARHRDRLADVLKSREEALGYERTIRELLERNRLDELRDLFLALTQLVVAHEKKIDYVAALLDAGRQRDAEAVLTEINHSGYLERADALYAGLTNRFEERRHAANSEVTSSVVGASIVFTLMSMLIVVFIWFGYVMSTRARRRMDELTRKIAARATHDTLTGLPNRDLFYDRLSQSISAARRKRQRIAVFYMDLDGFKAVNDTHSHQVGDATLREVARRLRVNVREMDTVARLGGDEFAVIVNDLRRPDDAGRLAEKIVAAISLPMSLYDSTTYQIGISIGIALYPDSGAEIDRLVTAADQAMYRSKLQGKNCWTFAAGADGDGEPPAEWIDFSDDFLVGVTIIDEQHQTLSNMLNAVNRAIARQQPLSSLVGQFDELAAFVVLHFQTEEQLMKQHQFPELTAHCEEHQRLLDEIEYLKSRFQEDGDLVVLQWLKDWLLGHIANSDRRLSDFLVARGVT